MEEDRYVIIWADGEDRLSLLHSKANEFVKKGFKPVGGITESVMFDKVKIFQVMFKED